MKNTREIGSALMLLLLTASRPAAAHFTLTKPASWLKEDASGGPQKGSPCGPGGLDDVKPIPASGAITDYHVGETIEVTWTDTIAHPGHFRIALAANRDDLKNPTIVQDNSCNYDESKLPTTASGNVLADGILFRSRNGFNARAGKMFSYMVTLPNQPCDKCTLQVMQIMENDIKALSNCYYFHCADIRILPAGQPSGTGASPGVGGSVGTGGFGIGGALGNGGGITGMGGTLGGAGSSNGAAGLLPDPGAGGLVSGAGGGATTPAMPAGGAPATAGPGASGGGADAVGGAVNGAAPASSEEDGGCAVTSRVRPSANGAWLAALLSIVSLRRRARRRAN